MKEKTPETDFDGVELRRAEKVVTSSQAKAWFVREVLPLEAMLTRFLAKNWRNKSDLGDFRQEIYAQVLDAAETRIPDHAKPFVFSVARNLLVDRFRKEHVIPIEAAAELDTLNIPSDEPGPERSVVARDLLRRLQSASTVFRRAVVKPSCSSALRDFPAAKSRNAWTSRSKPSPTISLTGCAFLPM